MNLEGRYVVVTGGSSGIGRAIARRCAGAGADVLITYRRNRQGADDAAREIAAAGHRVEVLQADIAREVAPDIRVNILAPGFIETAFGEEADPRFRDEVVKLTPLQRWGTPDDIASAALFLASDEAKFITGQMIMVNGGVV